ncbi:hypothetical protein ACVWWR_006534 [Bradyrhizobium sp. LM3.2]
MSDSYRDALTGLAAIVGDKHVIASGPDQEPYVWWTGADAITVAPPPS